MEAHGGIVVQVSPLPKGSIPTYALVWSRGDDGELESAGFQRLPSGGIAAFSLLTNHYYSVGAFTDENKNGKYDAGEPFGRIENVVPQSFAEGSAQPRVLPLPLTRENNFPAGTVIEVPTKNESLGTVLNIAVGDVVSLDDPRFAVDTGSAGMWRPLDFLTDNTVGIYFIEDYDAKRIPVVLVYGIGGSVQDWRKVIEQLDRSKYQVWFFHYPSGMRLERLARVMSTGLLLLKQRHEFSQCDVVAHSMGGLISTTAVRFAVDAAGTNFIPHLVTVSTPFGGHKAAALGVRHLKKPVPSWIDVKPESDFLHALYSKPFPKGTKHDLIYGELGADDGVVTVDSELEPRITNRVASITGFHSGHEQILNEAETISRIQQCLRD
jgi:pimeloyl-ACP methyl ester carboxylesterase